MSKPILILGALAVAAAAAVAFVFSKKKKSPDAVPTPVPGVVAIPPSPRLQALLGSKWKGAAKGSNGVSYPLTGVVASKLTQSVDEDNKPTQHVEFAGVLSTLPGMPAANAGFNGWINHAASVLINGRRKNSAANYMLDGKLSADNKKITGKGTGVVAKKSLTFTFEMKRV